MKIPNLRPLKIDVTEHESIASAVEMVNRTMVANHQPFVALINNAGIARQSPLEFHDLSDARTVFDTNVFGLLDCTQQFLPLLRGSRGRVVMISSVAGILAAPRLGVYSVEKSKP